MRVQQGEDTQLLLVAQRNKCPSQVSQSEHNSYTMSNNIIQY